MAHPRKTIRDRFATLLANLTTTSTRVFVTRLYPYDPVKEGGAGLLIYTLDEVSEPDGMAPVASRGNQRQLQVIVESVAAVNETLDDTLDTIAEEVEEALIAAGNDLSIGVKDWWLDSSKMVVRDQGEIQTGSIALTFAVLYRMVPSAGDLTIGA